MTITSLSRILSGHDLSMTQKLTSFVGMLDNYSTATTVAFSLRKLRTTYSGSAVRVRRSLDNTELDIGFNSAGDLDQNALTAFVGSNDGFVTTWYDQMGTNDAVETTAANQPRLVAAGVVKTYNGKPGIEWHNPGSTYTRLITTTGIHNSVQVHTVSLLRTGYSINARLISNVRIGPGDTWITDGYTTGAVNGGTEATLTGVSVLPVDTLRVIDVFGSSSGIVYIGNIIGFPRSWYGGISELVFFRTATTADERLQLDAQIMSYYGII